MCPCRTSLLLLQVIPPASPSPGPSTAATDEEQGGIKRARQRKRKEPEVVDERTARMQKRMVSHMIAYCVQFLLEGCCTQLEIGCCM